LLDDVGVGEGGDVASVHVIGDGGEDAAHDFSRARLGHVRNDVDGLGAGDLPIMVSMVEMTLSWMALVVGTPGFSEM